MAKQTLDIRAVNRLYASGALNGPQLARRYGVSTSRINTVLTPAARKSGRQIRTARLAARDRERAHRRLWLRPYVLAWLRGDPDHIRPTPRAPRGAGRTLPRLYADTGYRTCLQCLARAERLHPFDGRPRAHPDETPDWVLCASSFAPSLTYCRPCTNARFREIWAQQRKATEV